jgi:type II secretion system protein N
MKPAAMKRRALYIACGIPAALLVFLLLTLLFTPNDALKGLLVRVADNAGYTLECTGFHKSFPVGVRAESIELSNDKGALLKLRAAHVHLELLPLFTGKLRLSYDGRIGAGGNLEGEIYLGKSPGWTLQCRSVRLEDIPFFSTVAEAKVRGDLRVNGRMITRNGVGDGDMQMEVKGAEFTGVKVGVMPLPDASYRQVQGALRIGNGRAELKSFTLDGDGIYVRLKGDTTLATPVGNSPLNVTMEMMPKQSFLDRQKFVFLLLMRYQTSPGAFSIPIHGTLAHPSI